MPLPTLEKWEDTATALHHIAMLTGPIRNALFAHRNNYLELPMQVEEYGFSTGRLPQGGELCINLKQGTVIYHRPDGNPFVLTIREETQRSLFQKILTEMRAYDLADFIGDMDDETLITDFMAKLIADPDKHEFLTVEEVSHEDALTYDQQTAEDYVDALYEVFTGIARFRARLEGHMTPVVVWAEHFDLSTLWFPASNAAMDAYQAHLNFGFAPFSPGIPRPYLYVYAYPYPEGYAVPVLPENVRWETEAYTGPFLAYDDIAKQAEPAKYVERVCRQIYDAMVPLLEA